MPRRVVRAQKWILSQSSLQKAPVNYRYALFAPSTIGLAITDELLDLAAGLIGLTYEFAEEDRRLTAGRNPGESPAASGARPLQMWRRSECQVQSHSCGQIVAFSLLTWPNCS